MASPVSAGSFFSIDTNMDEVLADVREDMSFFSPNAGRVRAAISYAVNDTLKHMKSYASKLVRGQYYVKKHDLDKAIGSRKAYIKKTGAAIVGMLSFKSKKNLPLVQFGATQNRKFVSVRVLKANRKRQIQPGGHKEIVETQKGRAAVWIAKGHVFARTEKDAGPIILYGPSLMAFFGHDENKILLRNEQTAWLLKRLEHHVACARAGKFSAGYQAAGKGTGGAYK